MKTITCPVLTEKQEFIDLFEDMINYLIMYDAEITTDDLLVEMQEDSDTRQAAFDLLMSWLKEQNIYEMSPVGQDSSNIPEYSSWKDSFNDMTQSADKIVKGSNAR